MRVRWLLACLLLAGLAGGGVVLIRYLNSPEFIARLEQELSRAIKQPVAIGSITIDWRGGLRLKSVTIGATANNAPPLTTLESVSGTLSIPALLSGNIRLSSLAFMGPTVLLVEDNARAALDPVTAGPTIATAGPVPEGPRPPLPQPSGTPADRPVIDPVTLSDGSFLFFDRNGRPLLEGGGWGLHGALAPASDFTAAGRIRFAEFHTRPRFTFTGLETSFTLVTNHLTCPDIRASVCGGSIDAGFEATVLAPKKPFELRVEGAGLALEQIGQSLGAWPDDSLSGRCQLDFRGAGTLNAFEQLTGAGKLKVESWRVAIPLLLGTHARSVRIPEWQSLEFSTATARVQVRDQTVTLEQFKAANPTNALTLAASGAFTFRGIGSAEATLQLPTAGGRLNANLTVERPSAESVPFAIELRGESLDANTLATAYDAPPASVAGRLSFKFKGNGDFSQTERITGEGSARLDDALIRGIAFLQSFAQQINQPNLADAQFDSIRAEFRVADKQLVITQIETHPRDAGLTLDASGSIGFDGALAIEGRLALASGALGSLGGLLGQGGGSDRALIQIPFSLSGTLDDPKFALTSQSIGGSMLDDVLEAAPWLNKLPDLFRP